MKTSEDVMAVYNMLKKEVIETEEGRMNAMLSPDPLSCDIDSMTAYIRYEAYEWEKNHRGEVHGGIVAAMFDTAMGMSVIAFSDHQSVATSDLDVSFIRPFLGESFIFEINIIQLGRRIARVRALARDEVTGKTLASATSNFVYTD